MNRGLNPAEVVQTLSTLYELSLSVGTSLKLRENADAFLRALMTRKRYSNVSLWIKNRYLPTHLVCRDRAWGSEDLSLVYANPENSIHWRSASAVCEVFGAAGRNGASLTPDDRRATEFIDEYLHRQGVLCVFALGDLGYLVTLSAERTEKFAASELGQLKHIMEKFAVSLEGCLAHEKITREAEERTETIREQQEALMERSTPVIQVWEGILLMPLVGSLDAERGNQLTERLLSTIAEREATVAIIDVTGVPEMDQNVSRMLLDAVAAARILGTEVILTGLSPVAAQNLALLQVDFSSVRTRGSLRAGVMEAFELQGMHLRSNARK